MTSPGKDHVAWTWTEAQLDTHLRELVAWLRLTAYHTHDSRHSAAGFPDWVIAGPYGLLFRELKTQAGKLTGAQQKWAGELLSAGANYEVWRPYDAITGRITADLLFLANGTFRPPVSAAKRQDP